MEIFLKNSIESQLQKSWISIPIQKKRDWIQRFPSQIHEIKVLDISILDSFLFTNIDNSKTYDSVQKIRRNMTVSFSPLQNNHYQ